MNSSDLAEKIGSGQGMTKTDGRKLTDTHVVAVVGAAAATGEAIRIKASTKWAFTPAKAVNNRLRS